MKRLVATLSILIAACQGNLPLTAQSSNTGWTTYHGQYTGNRYSTLATINTANVSGLKVIRSFPAPSAYNPNGLEGTALVSGSTMYFTSTNSIYAYNLANGQLLWSFQRAPTPGLVTNAAQGYNRGVALSADSVFLATDNAHLLSFNALTGAQQWETVIADSTQNYGSTGAPLYLPALNLVIVGVSGGDAGVRGFLAAYQANNGSSLNNQLPVWQFYTTPASPSDPLAATWGSGAVLPHGCGATWTTGTYDSVTNVLYWGVGNACRDLNGDDRPGANLYTSSVLALNPSTSNPSGQLLWYFQFTPHGLWDYDGANVPMLVDATWQGASRNLMFHANRNGFFYVLDRGTGQYLAGFPFVNNLTWATGLDASGTPTVNPAAIPNQSGALACPSVSGGTNWMANAFSPVTSLFYVHALEYCNVFKKGALKPWQAGKAFEGGTTSPPPGMTAQNVLYAFNPFNQQPCSQTPCPLNLAWSYPESGGPGSVGGVLATAGGLVFTAAGRYLKALDASNGQLLWSHTAGSEALKSSPMTYQFNGKQFVAIATATTMQVYGL
ncbi:MAG: pyrroloquinoline quinone-dependent dehydrogenase [Bryobacteraceae bacterium]